MRWELGDGVLLSGLDDGSIDACVSTVVLRAAQYCQVLLRHP